MDIRKMYVTPLGHTETVIKERQVILIDPENLTGDGHLTPAETAWLTQVLPGTLDIQRDDLIFVGGDRHNAFELDTIAKALGGRIAFGTGKDGGDRALVTEFDKIPDTAWNLPDSPITRVVIASGDHHFVDTARLAKRKGRQVFTIGTWRGISAELAKHSDTCLRLPPMSPDTIDA
jgi:hypothetical protein